MIGVQLYGLMDALARDYKGVLKTLCDMGVGAIEPFISYEELELSSPSPIYQTWQEYGFSIPSAHVDQAILKEEKTVVDTLRTLHRQTGISTFVFSGMAASEKEARSCGAVLGKAAKKVAEYGISVLYHNHTMELATVPGTNQTILEVVFEAADDAIRLELDIGWAGIAGDETAFAERYAERIVEIHCKDFYDGAKKYSMFSMPKSMFAPIGEGIIQTQKILERAYFFPRFNGAVLIDQDQSSRNILDDIRIGFHNLQSLTKV